MIDELLKVSGFATAVSDSESDPSLLSIFGLPNQMAIPLLFLLAISITLLIWQFLFTFIKVNRIKKPIE